MYLAPRKKNINYFVTGLQITHHLLKCQSPQSFPPGIAIQGCFMKDCSNVHTFVKDFAQKKYDSCGVPWTDYSFTINLHRIIS